MGAAPFGANWHQTALFGVSFACTAVNNHFMIFFAAVPCVWHLGQLRLSRSLLSLIAPDRGVGLAWGSHRGALARARRRPLPRLDLRSGANVVAWGALWRVLHGRSFCPCVELKLQVGARARGPPPGQWPRGCAARQRCDSLPLVFPSRISVAPCA